MAGAPDNPSRRAVLGAAVALPLIASAAPGPLHHAAHGPPPRPGEEWERAVAAYRAAEAALEEAGRVCARATRAEVFAAEEVYGDRLEELYGRLRELLTAPAPDLRAFCAKVELMIEHEVATLAGGEACLEAVRREARVFA